MRHVDDALSVKPSSTATFAWAELHVTIVVTPERKIWNGHRTDGLEIKLVMATCGVCDRVTAKIAATTTECRSDQLSTAS